MYLTLDYLYKCVGFLGALATVSYDSSQNWLEEGGMGPLSHLPFTEHSTFKRMTFYVL